MSDYRKRSFHFNEDEDEPSLKRVPPMSFRKRRNEEQEVNKRRRRYALSPRRTNQMNIKRTFESNSIDDSNVKRQRQTSYVPPQQPLYNPSEMQLIPYESQHDFVQRMAFPIPDPEPSDCSAVVEYHSMSHSISPALFSSSSPSCPSPKWSILPIGGHGPYDATHQFVRLLPCATRISVVSCTNDETPLQILMSLDNSSPAFSAARQYIEQNASNFASVSFKAQPPDHQLVARISHYDTHPSTYLWPTAMAFHPDSKEIVILVCHDRSSFPWNKCMNAFNSQ